MKRHDPRARSLQQLAEEHAFASFLRRARLPVPRVLPTAKGASALQLEGMLYEVHERMPGADLYRDAMSWTPYLSLGHARSAGEALARFHDVAAGFPAGRRAPGPLMNSCEIATSPQPVERLAALIGRRPGLAGYLSRRAWRQDFERHHAGLIRKAAALVADFSSQWGHGDWHPSNLSWTSGSPSAEVAGIFDLGLANRTCALHDLATAIERAGISWLGLAGTGRAKADVEAVAALLDGYERRRRLGPSQLAALAALLPVVHVDYALSEVEYYSSVVGNLGNADIAYYTYLIGHTQWFSSDDGAELTEYFHMRCGPRAHPARRSNWPTRERRP